MNSFIAFGALLLSGVLTMSSGQEYISLHRYKNTRLPRADPMMSLFLSSNNVQRVKVENGDDLLRNDNEPDVYIMKRRNKSEQENFLNFLFRRFNDEDWDLDTKNKRIMRPIGVPPKFQY